MVDGEELSLESGLGLDNGREAVADDRGFVEQGTQGALEEQEGQEAREVRGRRRGKLPPAGWIGIAAAVFVVLFAFFWEATHKDSDEPMAEPGDRYEDEFPDYPPYGRSLIQDEIISLDWIYKEFIPINEFSRPGTQLEGINGIVIHFIGNPNTTAEQNRNFFANVAPAQGLNVSSNFIIGMDGEILQLVPVDEIAYASHHRNSDTLSVELCHPDETGVFTDETYASAVRLTAWLCARFGLTADDVLRHYDIVRSDGSQKACPVYFVENEEAWEAFLHDVTEGMRN